MPSRLAPDCTGRGDRDRWSNGTSTSFNEATIVTPSRGLAQQRLPDDEENDTQ
jgi:hypothetical protein